MGFGDARWDASLLRATSEAEAWLRDNVRDLPAVLSQASDAYAWIRTVDQWLQRFHGPDQHDVALGQGKVEYDERERGLLYAAIAQRMAVGTAASPSQELHQARLLVALASEGFLPWDQTPVAAAVTLCEFLLALRDMNSRRYVILIAETALRSDTAIGSISNETELAVPLLNLRGQYGTALGESSRAAEASRRSSNSSPTRYKCSA
jgi:hypothetical protein